MESPKRAVDPGLLMRVLHDEKLGLECIASSARVLDRILGPLCMTTDARMAMESITHGCEHLLEVYHQFSEKVTMSKPCLSKCDVNTIARRVAALHTAKAIEREIHLQCRCPDVPVSAMVDPLLIERLIVNLTTNALQYAPRGGLVVIKTQSHENHITICVRNTGPSIPPSVIPHLFKPYYKGPESTGIGIGLANVKQIAHLHGGTVRCASYDRIGTLMLVALPIEPDNTVE